MPAENYIYQRKAKHWGWKKVICLVEYGFPCSKLLWLGRNPSAVNLNFWAQQEEHVYGWYRLWYPYRPGINQFYQNTPLNVISFATYFGHTPTVFNSPRVILLASCKCCRFATDVYGWNLLFLDRITSWMLYCYTIYSMYGTFTVWPAQK